MKNLDIPDHPNPKPREVSLDEIFDVVEGCRSCPLGDGPESLEMGIGNESARVLILLDTLDPFGAYKSRMDALEKLLSPAHLSLGEVYVTSLIKCPMPPSRPPSSFEIEACSAILREEIRSIWPDVIVCMGQLATQFILHSDVGVDVLQGRMYRSGHFQVLPSFHIEQLMRDPASMAVAQKTMEKLGQWLKSTEG